MNMETVGRVLTDLVSKLSNALNLKHGVGRIKIARIQFSQPSLYVTTQLDP